MLDVDGNGSWPVSDVFPVSASEETMILEIVHFVTKTILTVTDQSAEEHINSIG